MKLKLKELIKNNDLIKLIRFSIVGVGNTLVNWSIFFFIKCFWSLLYYFKYNSIYYSNN